MSDLTQYLTENADKFAQTTSSSPDDDKIELERQTKIAQALDEKSKLKTSAEEVNNYLDADPTDSARVIRYLKEENLKREKADKKQNRKSTAAIALSVLTILLMIIQIVLQIIFAKG